MERSEYLTHPTNDLTNAEHIDNLDLSQDEKFWAINEHNKNLLTRDELVPDTIRRFRALKPIAIHEVGHELAALANGWHRLVISVVPSGNTLGFVKAIPNRIASAEKLNLQSIDLSVAGKAIQEWFGYGHHGGWGFDFAMARGKARLFGHGSVDGILNSRTAHIRSMILGWWGSNYIEQRATEVMRKGTIAA